MAESPSHRFGQLLGMVLEKLILPELLQFCERQNLYLDRHGERSGVRNGKKVTWTDKFENRHDLDFVIEKGGSAQKRGRPLAFIECAWRRYTKHSKAKAQEIQGAVLPIAETYIWDQPFLGAILAGVFTQGSLDQLRSLGFQIVFIPYAAIVDAFARQGIDVRFDESTPDAVFASAVGEIERRGDDLLHAVMADLETHASSDLARFLTLVERKLARHIETITITPMYGTAHRFDSTGDAVRFLDEFRPGPPSGTFQNFVAAVKFSNGDEIDGTFSHEADLRKFLADVTS